MGPEYLAHASADARLCISLEGGCKLRGRHGDSVSLALARLVAEPPFVPE